MLRYITKRLIGLIPVFFGITLISFFVIHLAPGKPTDVDTSMNPKISYESRSRLEKLYGFDKPVHVQYLNWLKRFATFDFGRSYVDGRPVSDKIMERIPVTLLINVSSMILILGIGIPMGVLSAVRRGSFLDKSTTVAAFIGFSVPEFWLALLLMSLFAITLGWLPISGLKSLDFEYYSLAGKMLDVARHLILPVSIAAFGSLAGISRYMRTAMVGVIHQDYIRTARAKGLTEHAVIYKHALKNALLPVITILGLSIPGLIGGSVIFESIFAIPGMGRLFYESVMARDYSTIMGVLSVGAMLTLLGNLLADIAYSYADPRIRITEGGE
ncbi:MAG: ABC transporter permease [Candidatus Omnitrophica bacterium]|nr:ABC transporter permease [Candidatus Omnitrophota bacterium]MDD5437211.1 ABC transporter permease [Candidatus Omnitrophota bacterium]